MPTLLERIAARVAYWHAQGVYRRFVRTLREHDAVQQRVLRNVLGRMRGSAYARDHGLDGVRSVQDLRQAAPIVTYDDIRPYVDRVCDGETEALFAPGTRIHMFATSSGTTARPKRIPVTDEFVRQYRRGWNTFGLKMLTDHSRAVLRAILQVTGRFDESRTKAGIPCGAITGLLARTQKGIVRKYYVGRPELAYIGDPAAKYYTLMRLAVCRDVAFAITANPATLIRLAQTANDESERLIRDVRDGTICAETLSDGELRSTLQAGLRPNPDLAQRLEQIRQETGLLRPRDFWNVEFLACWTGGSMGHYRERLREWWGPLPVRDIGLLASEGRVTIPLQDETPAGVLDGRGAVFEFIPLEEWEQPQPRTLLAGELETGRDYVVVLTNFAGLVRYRLDDVVRVTGWLDGTPRLEFLHRAGRVSSVAGEKLTENQAVAAVRAACVKMGCCDFDFILAPQWGDPPFYRLYCPETVAGPIGDTVDAALCAENEEYASRRKSLRLNALEVIPVPETSFRDLDARLQASRGSHAEQYKRPCLVTDPDKNCDLSGLIPVSPPQ